MRPKKCPACGHRSHRLICLHALPWWRRWLSGLDLCLCHYWDSRWGNQTFIAEGEEF